MQTCGSPAGGSTQTWYGIMRDALESASLSTLSPCANGDGKLSGPGGPTMEIHGECQRITGMTGPP